VSLLPQYLDLYLACDKQYMLGEKEKKFILDDCNIDWRSCASLIDLLVCHLDSQFQSFRGRIKVFDRKTATFQRRSQASKISGFIMDSQSAILRARNGTMQGSE
jgi:hypothetical protein